MLGEKFTGAELASEVNDKLSRSNGGAICGDVSVDGNITCDGITCNTMRHVAESGELIPFHAFKIIQYEGESSGVEGAGIISTQEIQVGINEIKLVMVFKHQGEVEGYVHLTVHPMGVATPSIPYKVEDQVLLEIVDGGFKVHTYNCSIGAADDANSKGLNSTGTYTALIFV